METEGGGRRIGVATLLLLVPAVPLILFGVARAAAPGSVIGLLFDDPWDYALFAVVLILAGGLLMAWRPFEAWCARALFGMRAPRPEAAAKIEPLLEQTAGRAGIEPARLLLRVEDSAALNAYAAAGHIVCVTTGALELPDRELEAILGHELGHHTELHPIISALIWWLSLPALPLKAALRFMRRLIATVGSRLGGIFRPVGLVLVALLWVVTFQLLWLVWVADVLSAMVARRTEFAADARAAEWGYAPALLEAYARLDHGGEPASRLERMMDSHPPMSERIARIRGRS